MVSTARHILRFATSMVMLLFLSISTLYAQYNKEYFLWQGSNQMIRNDYHGAITTLNTLLRVDKKAYEGYFMRGIAKYNLGDLIGAEYDLSLAIENNPVYTTAYTYRAITRSRLGNYDDALKDFAEAINLRPDLPEPYYSRGVTRLLNQQFDKAIEDFDLFIQHNRKVADAYLNRGVCYLQLRDTVRAYANFDTAIRTNRNSPDGYNRRGTLLMQQKEFGKAESDFDKAITNDSTYLPSLFNRALIYNETHRPYKALEDLNSLLRLDSLNSLSYFNRAIMLSQIGDYNRAIEDYDKVATLSPDNVLVYFYRANLLSKLGDIEAAEHNYTKAIDLYPDFANAYLFRSNIRMMLHDSQGALRDKAIADEKIAEHQSKLRDSSYSIYSDSTYHFDRLLSFDTKLAGASFESQESGDLLASQNNDLKLLPLFKFTLIEREATAITHREYYDPEMERFIADIDSEHLTIDYRPSNIPSDSLSMMEQEYDRAAQLSDEWLPLFELGVTQSLIKQYTSALASLSAAIELKPESPFLYINRAATRAEMIEFISSIESSFQRITIDSDPAKSLKNNRAKRNYNYDEAIEDIDYAIELHSDFAYNYYNKAGLMVLSGKLPEAYELYTQAIELYDGFAEAYYNRGIVQIMMKDTRKGCIDLSKAGELGVDNAYRLLEKYSK